MSSDMPRSMIDPVSYTANIRPVIRIGRGGGAAPSTWIAVLPICIFIVLSIIIIKKNTFGFLFFRGKCLFILLFSAKHGLVIKDSSCLHLGT